MKLSWALAAVAARLVDNVLAVAPTDSLMDADSSQSGYLPNHNMDPAIISSGGFGLIWSYSTPTGASEQFYSKPLVFTPSSTGRQIVLSFSEQNRIYALDAVNGTLYATRDLGLEGEIPFLVSDLGQCNDISGTIGVTGTPVIDPATDTVYFWAKSYVGTVKGFQNGAYRFHAIDAVTLQERAGFPVSIQGTPADNDPTRIFTGGNVLQRPALNLVHGVIFAGFGGHCDQYNYTGWIVGMQANTGKLLTAFATVGGAGSPAQDGTWIGGGGGAAVWQGGAAIASDQSGRIFFATGNGQKGAQNQGQPASGRLRLNTMNQAVVNMAVNPSTGVVTQSDYFEPYTYSALDNADRDLGSGGVCLPDPSVFSGNGVARMAISVGKNGVAYVMNADNLGGYKLGTGGTDAIIQTINMPGNGQVFGNVGTYPLEGGYMYVTPVSNPTLVYSLGKTSSGVPAFTLVGQSPDVAAGRVGTGSATITTFQGQPGTAILWVVDPDAGLRAYNAIPSGGQLSKINLPPSPSVAKFQRPAFGDGRYYLSTSNGKVLAYGSPVALPMTCTPAPLDFGQVPIGNTKTLIVTCKTNIAITKLSGFSTNKPVFQVSNSSLPTGPLALGATFSFPVIFNLTALQLTGSTSSPSVQPGVQTSSVWILSTNGKAGYAPQQPISLTGTAISSAPFITINPLQVDFGGVVVGSAAAETGSDNTFIISNAGLTNMSIVGMAWTTDEVNSPTAVFHNVSTSAAGKASLDDSGYFTSSSLPTIGQIIPAGSSMTIGVNFNSNVTGTYSSIVKFFTNGNDAYTLLTGSAATNPVALLEYNTPEGGWNTIPHCPNLVTGCTPQINFAPSGGLTAQTIQLRLTNNGGSILTVTKSKPLEGAELGATNPSTDFSEGMTIAPGKSAIASVLFSPGAAVLNADDVKYSGAWTLNTDDQTFGVHVITFNGVVTSTKTGPMTSAGAAQYKYLGCYQDYVGGVRMEPKQFNNVNNTNGLCQTQALGASAVFGGTEYMTECWVGNTIPDPSIKALDSQCSYSCAGDSSQACGGVNGFMSLYYDSLRYFPQNGTILGTSGLGPQRPKTIGAYTYQGCYSDAQNARSLTGKQTAGATISLDTCATFCSGYNFFGTEYANECYCANTLASTSSVKPDTDCNMQCASNTTQFCGAGSRLSLYMKNSTSLPSTTSTSILSTSKPASTSTTVGPSTTPGVPNSAYSAMGCYTDSDVTARPLVGGYFPDAAQSIELCAANCKAFAYFGVEYGTECYCGSAIIDSSSPASDGRCSMPCAGSASEICGGSYGMNIFKYSSASTSSTVSTVPTGTSSTGTVSSSVSQTSVSSTSAPSGSSSPFISKGCWSDNDVTERTLIGGAYTDQAMTLQLCAADCKGFAYFGVEYGVECYCGNTFGSTSAVTTDGRCKKPCGGDATQICGGDYGMNVYQVPPPVTSSTSTTISSTVSLTATSSTKSATPTPSVPSTINEFNYLHCHSDNTTIRTLVGKYIAKPDMTLERCAGNCTGYAYFGVEYASECYCSNKLSVGSYIATDGRCKMPCLGNNMEICGGQSGLTLYSNATLPGSSSSSSVTITVSTLSTYSSVQASSSSTGTSSTGLPSSSSSSASVSLTSSLSASRTSTSIRPTATGPIPAYINEFSYLTCSTDDVQDRTLVGGYLVSGSMTLDLCASTCAGYAYFGVEFIECFCGNTLNPRASTATDGRCNNACPGNSAEICGGSSGLTIYTNGTVPVVTSSSSASLQVTSSSLTISSSQSLTPTTSSSSSPAPLPTSSSTGQSSSSSVVQSTSSSVALSTSSSSLSLPPSTTSSSSISSTVSSSSSVQTTSSTQPSSSSSVQQTSSSVSIVSTSSSTLQTSSSTRATSTSSSTSSSRLTSSSLSSTRTSSSSIAPSGTASPDPWDYLGCMNDTITARAISGATYTNTTAMTVDMCKDFCVTKNYPLAALENLGICFCGLAVKNGGIFGQTGCTAACPGDKTQVCGGSKRLTVYNNTAYVPPVIPESSGAYSYTGCYTEITNGRAMQGYTFTNAAAMTVDLCAGTCATKGYKLAGLEFGTQCYCSNTISTTAAPQVDDSQCSVLTCPGNKSTYCSAASRLQVYST